MLNLKRPDLLRKDLYINGEWTGSRNRQKLEVRNPADGRILAEVADGGKEETRQAVEAAEKAFMIWRETTAAERSAVLYRWYELLMEHQEDLGALLTAEQGKPLAEAKGEIAYGANYLQWFAEEAKRINGGLIPPPAADRRLLVIRQPVGVVAAITPWNFPNAMLARKVAPALAAGCTVVAKPAKETPLSALALAALGEEAGVPPGVFNVVCGSSSKEIGGELTSNPAVRKLTFTGSTEVGQVLIRQCADTVKKVSMELGGNAPFVVFEDCDLDRAVEGAVASKFRNAGQTCVCTNRFLVQDSVYDLFCEKLVQKVSEFKSGNGMDPDTTMGPLIHTKAVEEVHALVQEALERGAVAVTGGKAPPPGDRYYPPTVLKEVTPEMKIFREEIFGPVATLVRFQTEEQALALANDTVYGLAAYLYTRDYSRWWRFSEKLEYGIVGVNEGLISNPMAPFGGVKQSGNGREGSTYGIEDYLEIKYLCVGGIE